MMDGITCSIMCTILMRSIMCSNMCIMGIIGFGMRMCMRILISCCGRMCMYSNLCIHMCMHVICCMHMCMRMFIVDDIDIHIIIIIRMRTCIHSSSADSYISVCMCNIIIMSCIIMMCISCLIRINMLFSISCGCVMYIHIGMTGVNMLCGIIMNGVPVIIVNIIITIIDIISISMMCACICHMVDCVYIRIVMCMYMRIIIMCKCLY